MIRSLNCASTILLVVVISGVPVASNAKASDYRNEALIQAGERCAVYGPGYIDMGHGACGRVHVRVESGALKMYADPWAAGGTTSSAALRSGTSGMVPGAGVSTHLRVRNGLETYSPFQ